MTAITKIHPDFIQLHSEFSWTMNFILSKCKPTWVDMKLYFSEENVRVGAKSWEIQANAKNWSHGFRVSRELSANRKFSVFFRFSIFDWKNGRQQVIESKGFYNPEELFAEIENHIKNDLKKQVI